MTDFSDPIVLASVVLAVSTIALVGVTTYYAIETRRIRRGAELPSFSLEASMVILSGQVIHMDLVNIGQPVTEVRVDCSWADGSKKLYVISLSTHGHTSLSDVPIALLADNQGILTVEIDCKDMRGKKYTAPTLTMDFGIAKREGRELHYQDSPIESITQSLSSIARDLRNNL